MFSRLGSAAFKKDITNTRILCERLGNPQNKFKSIHVGGTNGKGSTSHMLASIFQTAGFKTGLYTSPHLYDFRERIRINGEMAEKDYVVEFVERIKPAFEEIEPSFFEITVAMAFDYFARAQVDIAIIEVGLGGRLDSTNIIVPELSIITNIGWDHMNILGNSLPEIAFEKAGIIKELIPVVIGEKTEATAGVFEKIAQQKQAPLYFAEERFKVENYSLRYESIELSVLDNEINKVRSYQSDLPGIYQLKNIITVLQSVQVLKKWKITGDHIAEALRNVKKNTGLHGRWEVIRHSPTTILEVAHNRDGMQQMIQHLETIRFHRLHIVIGMVKDKEVSLVLDLLPKTAQYYFTQAGIPRALDASALQQMASEFQLKGQEYPDVNTALLAAENNAGIDDLIVVCGSIFLVAEVTI